MSKAEIIAKLSRLDPSDLGDIQTKLDELAGQRWMDNGGFSDADKSALDAALVDFQNNPNAGRSWEEVKARIQAKLRGLSSKNAQS